MSFKEIAPQVIRSNVYIGDKVKVGFPIIQGKQTLIIYLGSDVAKRLGLVDKDRLSLFVDEDNPFIMLLKKSVNGWTVSDVSASKTRTTSLYRMQVSWRQEVPETCKEGMKFVTWDFFEGGLRLALPGAKPEDRILY